MRTLRETAIAISFGLGAALPAAPAAAQSAPVTTEQAYPTRPVRVLVGSPGSMMDRVLRQLAPRLGERLGQQVVVENRSGAGVAPAATARAIADGYTILQADQTQLAVRPSLLKKPPYDPLRDFAPITLVASAPMLLIAHASVPAVDLGDFLSYAKTLPGGFDFATGGPASAGHLMAEQLKHATGINVVSVNYKGGGNALMAILAGEAKAGFSTVVLSLPYVKTGKLKAYAVTSAKRFSGAPELPTLVESGMPELEMNYWFGILAPSGVPESIIARLNREIITVLKAPDFRSALLAQGADPAPTTPTEFAAFLRSETARYKKLIERAGLRAE